MGQGQLIYQAQRSKVIIMQSLKNVALGLAMITPMLKFSPQPADLTLIITQTHMVFHAS